MPTLLVIVGVCLTASFGLYWATHASDEISVQRQVRTARASIDQTLTDLVLQQKSDAVWTPLVRVLEAPVLDRVWLQQNTGSWLFNNFNLQEMYILDGSGQAIYGSVAGDPVEPAKFSTVAPAVHDLLHDLHGRYEAALHPMSADRTSGGARGYASSQGALYSAGIVNVEGHPALASAMQIASPGPPLQSTPFVMLNLTRLDDPFLKSVAERYMLSGLRFMEHPTGREARYTIPLHSNTGALLGYLVWKPELPGNRILHVLAPISVILVSILGGLIVLLITLLWRAVKAQSLAITELQASEAQAQHLAFHDVLTGLANRALFDERLDQAMALARRGQTVALLALDLDRFKNVNDTLGHAAGDTLLKEVAARLGALLGPSDTMARVGGDEFCIVLTDIRTGSDVDALCQRILSVVHQPFRPFDRRVFVGMSIGVALAPEATLDRGELLRKADIALYAAKAAGRNCVQFFNASMDEAIRMRRQIEEDLREALRCGDQLYLDYQPEISAQTQQVIGVEALIRWRHPSLGVIPPDRFIAIAEDTDLIHALGDWVMGEAARAANRWPGIFMAINLSPVQFRSPNFAERVARTVREAGCDPHQIELEITERVLLDDDEGCHATLRALRCAGFRIALDDFGSGYSSLSYLRRFKVDKIKIDRSYTESLGQNVDSAAIVTSLVTLGRMLGLTVAAEGVETQEQRQALSAAGCHELQGFLFSRPIPVADVEELLNGTRHLSSIGLSSAAFGRPLLSSFSPASQPRSMIAHGEAADS